MRTNNIDIIVLGGGIVGVSVAAQLQRRGATVVLVDREEPGRETSFGNAGLIQNEAVLPYTFPRQLPELFTHALGLSTASSYHLRDLPRLIGAFHRYWRNSTPERVLKIAQARAPLILRSVDDHLELAGLADCTELLRQTGWTQIFRRETQFEAAAIALDQTVAEFSVDAELLDGAALKRHEPALMKGLAGAIHWRSPLAVSNPLRLTNAYTALFEKLGGKTTIGDARSLRREGSKWSVALKEDSATASEVVIALGPWAPDLTARFGYAPPMFCKRGYHRHHRLAKGPNIKRPVLDSEYGFVLAPMDSGIRVATGAEFCRRDAPPTPVQLRKVEPLAHALMPALGDRITDKPWLGSRPCTPDMLPIIGRLRAEPSIWCAFGHGHHGLTLGPTTGVLLAQMMFGDDPFTDPTPYRADRF